MSLIKDQIKALKEHADYMQEIGHLFTASIIRHAAETIETLSEKVRAANMERSTAYYHGGWIPVKERLPEDKTYVLVTIKIPGRQAHARSGWYQSEYFHNDNGDVWENTDLRVLAWMPLPEPYREDGETE